MSSFKPRKVSACYQVACYATTFVPVSNSRHEICAILVTYLSVIQQYREWLVADMRRVSEIDRECSRSREV